MKMHLPMVIIMMFTTFLPAIIIYIARSRKRKWSRIKQLIYWTPPTLIACCIVLLKIYGKWLSAPEHTQVLLYFMLTYFTLFLTACVYAFFVGADLLLNYLFRKKYKFRYYLGIPLAAIVFGGMICGYALKHYIQVREVSLYYNNLPEKFDGLKIVQFTDLHLGNLVNKTNYLDTIAQVINAQKPDLILFTGDLFNLSSAEGERQQPFFDKLHAKLGKYAVLGNHDYGDYVEWKTPEEREMNHRRTLNYFKQFHFTLLNDEFAILEHDSLNRIGIIGVEYCGQPPFKNYGSLEKAVANCEPAPFNILLTHDPNQWKSEVVGKRNIDLTLSGHTHSAQLGIDLGWFKYSPSQWIFTEWDGLYREANQFLYVSRGLGYVGIPFRLGMRPEITVITLHHKADKMD